MPSPREDLQHRSLSVAVVPALLVCLAAPAMFVVQVRWIGYVLLALGLLASLLLRSPRQDDVRVGAVRLPSLTRDLSLIALGMVVVSSISLHAELDNAAMVRFTLALGGAVALPYVVSRFVYRDHAIRFPWRGGGRWNRWQWAWLVFVIVAAWVILPFYFISSGVYQNWPVVDDANLIARLFVGVGAVGIWDELFFICTCFALLRRHFSDLVANLLQAVIFVSFLWELGYQAWGPALTIPFALLQGWIFLRTKSLWYVVSVHLLFDAVVFAVIVYAHNPGMPQIFLIH